MRRSHLAFFSAWYRALCLPKHPRSWHLDRLEEERRELREARGWIARLSETSDIHFTILRAHVEGLGDANKCATVGYGLETPGSTSSAQKGAIMHGIAGRQLATSHQDHDDKRIKAQHSLSVPQLPKDNREIASTRASQTEPYAIPSIPHLSFQNTHVYAYMFGKFTLRWGFYRMVGLWVTGRRTVKVNEVINPAKDCKMRVVALRHGINEDRFVEVGRWVRVFWPLLP